VVSGTGDDAAALLLEWLGWTCANRVVLDELGRATDAISRIVRAVRAYTFLDQAPLQDVDVVETLENTLIILSNRLKDGIRVIRRYTTDLRKVTALGGELTQLWTNLIDNAIDAMEGKGDLEIVVEPERDCIAVRVIDGGPGIPDAVLPRIFEPFFTTKGPGQGTGVGLHVAYGVVRRHHGRILVNSRPGRTEFKVVLPPGGAGPGTGAAGEAEE
jgi:signal transduction histidine kinase